MKSDPCLNAYIQPGGCLELYHYSDDGSGSQDFPHFCTHDVEALEEMIQHWKEKNAASG